jgi:hypothetical protein
MAIDNTDNELDDLVRVAMKTLDAQVPSGYFDGLPNRTLARLEDSSMQTTSGTSKTESPVVADLPAVTPPAKERDEDSGLHDIRNLASSQRSRLSSRRLGTNPPPMDEQDVLSSTSGSWKSIALPEPAKMISLPEMSMPSKADIKAQEKAAKAAEKLARKSRPSGEMQAPPAAEVSPSTSIPSLAIAATPATAVVVDAPVTLDEIPSIAVKAAVVDAPMIGSRISGMKAKPVTPIGDAPKKKRGALIASLGVVVAAAAGVVIYVSMDKKSVDQASVSAGERQRNEESAKPTATATPVIAEAKPDKAEPAPAAGSGSAVAAEPDPVVEPAPPPPVSKVAPTKGKKPPSKPIDSKKVIEVDDPGNGIGKKPAPPTKTTKEPPKEGDPDFDKLLKDSGYQKKIDKPKLEKKELSATDFPTSGGNYSFAHRAGRGHLRRRAGNQHHAGWHHSSAPDDPWWWCDVGR